VAQKLARVVTILTERTAWSKPLAPVKRMRQWVLEAEQILGGSEVQGEVEISNATVGHRLDTWRATLAARVRTGSLAPVERECRKRVPPAPLQLAALPGAVLRPSGVPAHQP
jgi:hypothetical protein